MSRMTIQSKADAVHARSWSVSHHVEIDDPDLDVGQLPFFDEGLGVFNASNFAWIHGGLLGAAGGEKPFSTGARV